MATFFPKCRFIQRGSKEGKSMAVLTSGGDSQGMNATIRACVRTALYLGCKVYFIRDGYSGMVKGDDSIVEADWVSVSSIIHRGGTIIGSARCKEFLERDGRLKAAANLMAKAINYLIIIGGDGSLTGANLFRNEWPELLEDLIKDKSITPEQRDNCRNLHIVGIVGSIDNDFCCTDMTIGADSALHRICEAVDAIISTAFSHQRTFILEIMGRRCGYLTLKAGLATGADWIFIPENPPSDDWPDLLCDQLCDKRRSGKRYNIILVAEGAIDINGNPITAQDVKTIITEKLQQDTRITVLGHLQRGGNPSAFDRILGCRTGVEAAISLMDTKSEDPASVVCIVRNKVKCLPLMECINRNDKMAEALEKRNFELMVKLRGEAFESGLELYKMLKILKPQEKDEIGIKDYRLAVLHIGTPACGMNAAVRCFVRSCIYHNVTPLGVFDGIEGLISGRIKKMLWSDVLGWVSHGGAFLGAKEILPEGKFRDIANRLKEFRIHGLLFIGGFEAYHACGQLFDQRNKFPEFCIPLLVIPATISNNVPGTDFSIGCDTSLNLITTVCDHIRQSAQGTRHRVFIIETMGGYCGYLATMGALAGGADSAYIFEEKFGIADVQQDVAHITAKMAEGVQRGLVLNNEYASENYNSDFLRRLYAEEGKNVFSCRLNVLGHIQQGGAPSPCDRELGTELAIKAVEWFVEKLQEGTNDDGTIKCTSAESACLLGKISNGEKFTPIIYLLDDSNFIYRIPHYQWWLKLRPLLSMLSKHYSAHKQEIGTYIANDNYDEQLHEKCYQ